MKRGLRFALIVSVLLWGGQAATGRQADDGNKAKKGRSNMTLDLRIKLKRGKVITRESTPIEVTLENLGSAPVEVPDPRVGTDFRYTLRSRTDAKVEYHLSATRAQAERYQEPLQPHTEPGTALAPGTKQSYDQDLADYELPVVGPGTYGLVVGYQGRDGLLESAVADLAITPPHVARMVTAAGMSEERVAVLFVNAADGKHGALYQIENEAGRPGDGVAYPRKEGFSPADVYGLALAVDLDYAEGRRWFAWQQGGNVCAGVGQARYLSHLVEPVAHGLHDAALGPVGWQPTNDDAFFVALGADHNKHATLAVVHVALSSAGSAKAIPIAGPTVPEAWVAQYRPAGSAPQLDLITAEHHGASAKIVRQTIGLVDGKVGAPVTLLERAGKVAALAMPPVGRGPGDEAVDVLFATDPGTGYLSLVRVHYAAGAARPAAWDFFPPKDAGAKHPTAWAIPHALVEPPLVVAHAGDKIYRRRAGGDWSAVVSNVSRVEHLTVEAFRGGRMVAVWVDPGFGVRYQTLP
jgi:hypothetical protein